MGVPYSALRNPGVPTAYGPNKTAVSADVTFAGFVFAFIILAISFLFVLPGIRSKNRIHSAIRFSVGMFIGASILLSIYGQNWEVASVKSVTTAYKAFSDQEIVADIGVNIGLTNVNVTLKGVPEKQVEGKLRGERINYNERFTFCCNQGRGGFGPNAGRINREFRAAQWKGLPYPILWIAEYFTLDGEDIRWGRSYRVAGFYTYMVLWTAFCLWILALILSFTVLRYCGIFLVLTGVCLLSSNIIYATVRYGSALVIPFSKDHVLEFGHGGSFNLCMVGGIVSTLAGIAIIVLDDLFPFKTAIFFNVDPLQDYQDTYHALELKDKSIELFTGPTVEHGKGGMRASRPASILNEDPRIEQLAAEAVATNAPEAYKGNLYINVAVMRHAYVPARKGIFQQKKSRLKRLAKPVDDPSGDNHEPLEKGAGNSSSQMQLLHPSSVEFSAGLTGDTPATDDSVATDTVATITSIRMSEIEPNWDDKE